MPVLFQANDEGARELQSIANLAENSITQVKWIKNPECRSDRQRFANLKIHCSSAEAANSLIMGSGRISHLGSQIQFHKDIKAPGTCSRCQEYGHPLPKCRSANTICAKCGEPHHTSECQARNIKCTPCGSTEHQTNDVSCPERIAREEAILTKKPELLTPYFITAQRWTWDLPNNTPLESTEDTLQQNHRIFRNGTHHGHPAGGLTRTQRTLLHSGFHCQPRQTGANSIPINPKKSPNNRPPSPAQNQGKPPSPKPTHPHPSITPPQPNPQPPLTH